MGKDEHVMNLYRVAFWVHTFYSGLAVCKATGPADPGSTLTKKGAVMFTKYARKSIALVCIAVGIGGGVWFVLYWGNFAPIMRGILAFTVASAIWIGEVLWEGNTRKRFKKMLTPTNFVETGIWAFLVLLVLLVSAIYPFGAALLVVMILYEFLRPRKETEP